MTGKKKKKLLFEQAPCSPAYLQLRDSVFREYLNTFKVRIEEPEDAEPTEQDHLETMLEGMERGVKKACEQFEHGNRNF